MLHYVIEGKWQEKWAWSVEMHFFFKYFQFADGWVHGCRTWEHEGLMVTANETFLVLKTQSNDITSCGGNPKAVI